MFYSSYSRFCTQKSSQSNMTLAIILEISGYPSEIVQEVQGIDKSLSDATIHNRYSEIQTEEIK